MEKLETFKLTFNIPVDLLKQVDGYAKKMSVNRTSAMCFLLSQSLKSEKVVNGLDELLKLIKSKEVIND